MTDEPAIQRVLNRYTEGSCRTDWDQVIDTFTPEGTWGVPAFGLVCEGKDAVLAGLKSFVEPMAYLVQINAPALITITGDTATARSPIRESGKYADRDEALEVLGIYADKLVRTPEGWKFTERCFELLGLHTFPVNPAQG
jgi:hypothetical protein